MKVTRQDLEALSAAQLRQHEARYARTAAQSRQWSADDWEIVECIAERERREAQRREERA